ncbi:MAG: helix-turn-helix transcriptional regulator [Ruminococcaceae bacterium]|nr:helix-turn-helix transcriptional regulator [Oscillospiraceae bacterium]
MELQAQIKKYRTQLSLSQDELAEKIFVSRQSISNWENGKTYPDIRSLLLLSEVFGVSLDQLVKGDIEIMKKAITEQDIAIFRRDSYILFVFMLLMLLLPFPLFKYAGWWGAAIYLLIFTAGMFVALKVERQKKKFNIQTYKEIVAFYDGKTLDEIEAAKEEGKRPYQKVLMAAASAVVSLVIFFIMYFLFR